jgi:hypothetical protein
MKSPSQIRARARAKSPSQIQKSLCNGVHAPKQPHSSAMTFSTHAERNPEIILLLEVLFHVFCLINSNLRGSRTPVSDYICNPWYFEMRGEYVSFFRHVSALPFSGSGIYYKNSDMSICMTNMKSSNKKQPWAHLWEVIIKSSRHIRQIWKVLIKAAMSTPTCLLLHFENKWHICPCCYMFDHISPEKRGKHVITNLA